MTCNKTTQPWVGLHGALCWEASKIKNQVNSPNGHNCFVFFSPPQPSGDFYTLLLYSP